MLLDGEAVRIIDCDSHVIDPPDLWQTRLSRKHRDAGPKVLADPDTGRDYWQVGPYRMPSTAQSAYAGWEEPFPSTPPNLEQADPACFDPIARVERLDEHGIDVQLLFPQIVGFQISTFAALEHDLSVECIRAYNDFQTDFASVAPDRLIPQMNLPLWDLDASLAEMRRCADLGHKAVNFGVELEELDLPSLRSGHWDPLLAQAQDLELPIVFHIGFSKVTTTAAMESKDPLHFVKGATLFMLGNANQIVEIILSGTAHRFPRLDFVSIESGFGYLPYLIESLEWQYLNLGAPVVHPEWLLPSEYFRRQIFASFWFESTLHRQIDMYPDNAMFSSDFPHPTSLSPGPGSVARNARETIEANLADVAPDIRRKLLHDTAARVYHIN